MTPRLKVDPHKALGHALISLAAPATLRLINSRATSWASATFDGQRHQFQFSLFGEGMNAAYERMKTLLDDDDFLKTGHIIADLAFKKRRADWHVSPPTLGFEIEALTIKCDYLATPSARRSEEISPKDSGLSLMARAASAISKRAIKVAMVGARPGGSFCKSPPRAPSCKCAFCTAVSAL